MNRLVLILWIIPSVISPAVFAQISPGELSRAHESLEGVDRCTQCHEQGTEITGAKCLACHADIRSVIASRHGMHFRNSTSGCVSCHKEHLGKTASITLFDPRSFDHARTGYLLTGKHAAVPCVSCHAPQRITDPAVQQMLKQHPRQTYLGLQDRCSGCHADRHGRTLGENCRSCHTPDGWKPAAAFNHGMTKFPLAGKHASIACLRCHPGAAVREPSHPVLFAVKEYADCTPCHASPHGKSPAIRTCKTCHVAEGWSVVRAFDHGQTGYPLIGKHTAVACARCHTNLPLHTKAGKKEFATQPFRDCSPCHASPHEKSFSGKPCTACHTPAAWAKVPEQSFDHSLTSFPLRGKHASVPCEKCHGTAGKKTFAQAFKLTKTACADCHEDAHRGQFLAAFKNDCARCHTEESYRPSTYTIARHAGSRYPLAGAHLAVPCRSCHEKNRRLEFRFATFACTECHTDPHGGRFADVMKDRGCRTCHATTAWGAVVFDHAGTGFPLTGAHERAACTDCHKKGAGSSAVQYKGTTAVCGGCHADPHAGQFTENGQTPCERCHSSAAWKSLLFRHNLQSSFPLTGGHERVKCEGCHPVERIGGVLAVRYKPLSSKCESCHTKG